ncbi:two-component regulator propeller domain-containing protein [uncultured Parabacteroides sp.]|uniref:hybrid sensor histidine kinase/response regulator transcription factor n=1 Tax=uncultured Parabacteroides sp. TaxID=512312 RepID=UPI0028046535|nr:two-component regulator propeller domain-containing protein [uncultured Parabacteroides sp.]
MIRFFLSIIFLFSVVTIAHPVYFNHLGVKDGLPQLSVHAIYQDELGRLWFGTQEGISVYNGEKITNQTSHFQSADGSINDYTVNNITGTSEGDVFFLIGNLLVRYDLRKDHFHALKENVSSLQKIRNKIYFSSSDSIFLWDLQNREITFQRTIPIKSTITSIGKDYQERLWIGTKRGLYVTIGQTEDMQCVIPDEDISTIFESSNHDIWIGTRLNGLYCYSRDNKLIRFVSSNNSNSISHNYIRAIAEDGSGNIWIGTFYGLNKYDPVKNRFSSYEKNHKRGDLSHSSILSLFIDKQGILWVGTYYGGINYFNSQKNPFNYYSDDPVRKECLNFPFIGQMVEDNNNDLWICTDGGGLNKLDRKTGLFSYYTASKTGNSIRHNNLKCIDYDPESNQLYIGTYTGGLCRLDLNKRIFHNYIDNASSLPDKHVNISWLKIYKNYVIFVDDNGLFKLNKKTDEITPLFQGSDRTLFFGNQFIVDSKENLWLIHFTGVTRIPLRNPSEKKTFHTGEKGLGTANLSFITEISSNRIFIATSGNGIFLYNEKEDVFQNYNAQNGYLLSDFCYSITESPDRNLIISCNKGISFLNLEKQEQFFSASIEKDLPFSAINSGCGIYKCKNNEIFIGSADGMISFWESDFICTNTNYNLYFSSLSINHKNITPAGHTDILTTIPAYTSQLTLSHNQNNLIVEFASSNYLRSNNSSVYEYKLEGFDSQWIPTHNTHISYTNLSPGKYALYIREKGLNTDPGKEIQMSITILPPFYRTPIAWTLYIVLFTGSFYIFVLFRQRQVRLNTSLEYERKEKEYITNLNKAKSSFFANISHEFRTPLSIIVSQIEILLNNNISLSVRQRIYKIYQITFQMQDLINELLDFQKLEQKQAKLSVSRQNLIPFLHDIYILFEEKALVNQIGYSFSPQKEFIECWVDLRQLKKVIINLLSNAFKFTPSQRSIELFVDSNDNNIIIKVIDNGIGIDKKDLANIFERYYQVSNNIFSSSKEFSTGLGLSLCKEIVGLHHGTIQVESKLDYGSIFIITLQTGKSHFEQDPNVEIEESDVSPSPVHEYVVKTPMFMDNLHKTDSLLEKKNDEPYKILIVEDNADLLDTLTGIFSPFYHVLQAHDGVEGLNIAHEEKPDIIVSDIMMPKMNGDQMCLKLKQHIETCHIPIVLLTALSSNENNINGLLKGADDYITKPFNTKILIIKCNNLIRNRLLLQQKYQNEPASTMQLLACNETDKLFLQKIETIIESHLDDTVFSIDRLAEEIAISRRSLYNKFKQLTGMTPNDFILNYKLKKAAFLLTNDINLSIGEIADRLGFGSPRYFSRCFKNQFDISPMDYRNNGSK